MLIDHDPTPLGTLKIEDLGNFQDVSIVQIK